MTPEGKAIEMDDLEETTRVGFQTSSSHLLSPGTPLQANGEWQHGLNTWRTADCEMWFELRKTMRVEKLANDIWMCLKWFMFLNLWHFEGMMIDQASQSLGTLFSDRPI